MTVLVVYNGVPALYDEANSLGAESVLGGGGAQEMFTKREVLVKKLEVVKDQVLRLRLRASEMEKYFNEKNIDVIEELQKVGKEIDAELEKINRLEKEKQHKKAEAAASTESSKQQKTPSLDEPQPQSSKSSKSESEGKISTLFKRIAAKCHPDKTKSKAKKEQHRLSILFIRAHKCKSRLDYEGLVAVWYEIERNLSTLLRKLVAELKSLEGDITAHNIELGRLKELEAIGLLTMYENPDTREMSAAQFRTRARIALQSMKDQLWQIKASGRVSGFNAWQQQIPKSASSMGGTWTTTT